MRLKGLAILAFVIVCGCSSSSQAIVRSTPPAKTIAGGCAGTVLSSAQPPAWAQGGWTVGKGDPWPVPWAMGSSSDAVAFVFAGRLVAGSSPRRDGTNNKILWDVRDANAPYVVEARPHGASQPVISIQGGPSIVDLPTPGCWTFTIGAGARSTVSLDVLPAGSLPSS